MTVGIDLGSTRARVATCGADGMPVRIGDPRAPGHGTDTSQPLDAEAVHLAVRAALTRAEMPECVAAAVAVLPQRRLVADHHAAHRALAGALGGPSVRVLGTALAVLVWIQRTMVRVPALCVVCDLGASGIDVTLCTVRSGLVTVIDTVSVTWPDDLDPRLDERAAQRPNVVLRADDNPRYRDTPIYEADGDAVTAGELIDVFAPYGVLAAGAVAELRERHRARLAGAGPEGAAVLLVGGLAGFPLAARRIAAVLPPCAHLIATDGDPAYLAAFGAALVAAGQAGLAEHYPHAVALRTRVVDNGGLHNRHVLVAPAGRLADTGNTIYAEHAGEPVLVDVERADTCPVQIDLLFDDGPPAQLSHRPVTPPAPGRYRVGLRLVDGRAELVFEPVGSGIPTTCLLGPLPATRTGVVA